MRLQDLVTFRRDLLFNGAVQIGWLEANEELAEKAASHFAFHGPAYHGVDQRAAGDIELRPVDTATFTLDVVERITGQKAGEPFTLAVAGYGTGKSHLGVTLASLLRAPHSPLARRILSNLASADPGIGGRVRGMLDACEQPFLVVAINGMRDFDLTGEVVRQVLDGLRRQGIDTSALEDLRPRFRYAINFTESLYEPLRWEYGEAFGAAGAEEIIDRLRQQDEDAFQKVSVIYERKTGTPIRAVGQESLDDFVRVTREIYCGKGKPFAGIVILFDEFGRYLEFSVQRPHMAGPGALQQLFEAVQANADAVFLLSFIQYELKAYVSRVAPELRDDLQRYVTRYDVVQKARLSTNLETLIANLLEKRDPAAIGRYVARQRGADRGLQADMKRWFPEIGEHAIWANAETFARVVQEGCWPLHPLSTWLLYRLASVGRSLQQRSALSLLADAYNGLMDVELAGEEFSIAPADVCGEALIDEFAASERFGQQGAAAHAYRSVLAKYENQMSAEETRALKAVLLMAKTSPRIASREECLRLLALFSGQSVETTAAAIELLESDKGAASWNEGLHRFEIVSDAVPKAQFLAFLQGKIDEIDGALRGQIFSESYARWFPDLDLQPTDFGETHQIPTREWSYKISFANVDLLLNQIDYAFRNWLDARNVDQPKGQLVYCYVGVESDLATVRELARRKLKDLIESAGLDWQVGAPIAIAFLHDVGGEFGEKVAEYQVLQKGLSDAEVQRYGSHVPDREITVEQELKNLFEALGRERNLLFGTGQEVDISRLATTLRRLLEVVYPRHVPFPFDGFYTVAGNAAKDCGLFTRELFLRHLDREWIAARPARERNRAVAVLDDCWQALDNAGAVRIVPGHAAVRQIVEDLDGQLTERGKPEPLNLGRAFQALCAPPYGCSVASAGLLLALFAGGRKIEFLRSGQPISIENWLQAALPRNFLEPSVLDTTVVVRVSKEAMGEWNVLLNTWEIEASNSGKVEYRRRADELAERLPVPQELYYQYENLCLQTKQAQQSLRQYERALDDAARKIGDGIERGDVRLISWGAAEMSKFRDQLEYEDGKWTADQIRTVEKHEAVGRLTVQQLFPKWLPHQKATGIGELSIFLHQMGRIGGNLQDLGLLEEKADLENHTRSVEEHITFLNQVHQMATNVDRFVRTNRVSGSSTKGTILGWLEQVEAFRQVVEQGRQRKLDLTRENLDGAMATLAAFERDCKEQLERLKERALKVYNAEVYSLSDIQSLESEVRSLRQLYDGRAEDVADLDMVLRQLDSLERHYRLLCRDGISNDEFEAMLAQYSRETEAAFGNDEPPLDNKGLYEGIAETIRAERQLSAGEWMRANVPEAGRIAAASAEAAQQVKTRLQAAPRLLSQEQMAEVRKVIAACDRRLDELKVDGLVARYERLEDEGKQVFRERIGVVERGQEDGEGV